LQLARPEEEFVLQVTALEKSNSTHRAA